MTARLLNAIEALHSKAQGEGILGKDVESIDQILSKQRPRKGKLRKTPGEVKSELTKSFLTPPTSLSDEWLNKLQQ